MDKRWAHCKVGIAGALPLLHRFGSNPRQGTLICPKCKATNLLVLHADGCNRCHKPEKIDPQSYAGNYLPRTEPFEQLPETLVLKARVDELMKWKGMKHFSTFAKTIGVDGSGFAAWYRGHYGELGQSRMKTRIEAAIKRWLAVGLREAREGLENFNEDTRHCLGHDTEEDEQNLFKDYPQEEVKEVGSCWS